jgi:hydroxyacylglutathione hydrolase
MQEMPQKSWSPFMRAGLGVAALGFGVAAYHRRRTSLARYATASMPEAPYPATPLSDRFVVYTVPMFDDNYGWLITDTEMGTCVAVDPGEPGAIVRAVEQLGLQLTRVLITHKHGDHTGGNTSLKKQVPGLEIVGTGYEPIPGLMVAVEEGDKFDLFGSPQNLTPTSVIATPCHTKGHVVFFVEPQGPGAVPALFSGDTLFVGGCGRFFEGTANQMYDNLVQKIARLPDETLVFCAHEYTESNLSFALQVEPDNSALQAKVKWVQDQRAQGLPTVPSTLGEEQAYNPFMRCGQASVMARVGASSPVDSMHLLREGKNRGQI